MGRNEACPCGSGRKFKQCCLRRPPALDLDARTLFAWWKVHAWALSHHIECVPEVDFALGPAAIDILLFSIQAHMIEGGALDEVLGELGGVLPGDEEHLVRSWVDARHRLWSIERASVDGGARLRDEATGEVVEVVGAQRAAELQRGRHVIGLVVAGPASLHLVGHPLLVRPDAVDAVRGGLGTAPDEEGLDALAREAVDRDR